jgi:GT2 family glycosyltransferase
MIPALFGAVVSGVILAAIVKWQLDEERRNATELEDKRQKDEREKELAILEVYKSRITKEIFFNYTIIKELQHALTLRPKHTLEHWNWLMTMCDSFSFKDYDSFMNTGLTRYLDKETEVKYYSLYASINYIKNKSYDYILLLNDDTIVDRLFLSELLNVAQQSTDIGILGPMIYFYDYDGRKDVISFAGGLINKWICKSYHIASNSIDNGQYTIRDVDYVEGSCILINKEVLEEIGFLDTSYFAYWEEADLCKRGFEAGHESVYVPKAKIWHKVSTSFNDPIKLYYYSRNKIKFMRKNAGRIEYISFLLYFFVYGFWITNFCYFCTALKEKNGFEMNKNFIKGVFNGLVNY